MSTRELRRLDKKMDESLGVRYRGNLYCRQNRNNDLVSAIMDEAERCRVALEENNGVEWFLVERALAKKAWVEVIIRSTPYGRLKRPREEGNLK